MELDYQHALGISAQLQAAIGGEISRLCCLHVSPPSGSKLQLDSILRVVSVLSACAGFVEGQWRSSEIDAEAFAPNRNRAVFRQVQVGRESIVLISDVSLDGP